MSAGGLIQGGTGFQSATTYVVFSLGRHIFRVTCFLGTVIKIESRNAVPPTGWHTCFPRSKGHLALTEDLTPARLVRLVAEVVGNDYPRLFASLMGDEQFVASLLPESPEMNLRTISAIAEHGDGTLLDEGRDTLREVIRASKAADRAGGVADARRIRARRMKALTKMRAAHMRGRWLRSLR